MKTKLLCLQKLSLYFLTGIALTISACSVEDGMDGETGPAGADGNANVIVSDWMPIVRTWAEFDLPYGEAFMDIPVDNMATFMENGGIALMYYKNAQNARVVPFYTEYDSFDFGFGTFSANENYQTEAFEGFRFYYDGIATKINLLPNSPESIGVRYVLVPASVVETTGLSAETAYDFDETMELLGIAP